MIRRFRRGSTHMSGGTRKAKTLVGLDVHATKIVAAVPDAETGQLQTFAMSSENARVAAFCAGLPRTVRGV